MPSVNNSLIGAVRGEASLESGKFVSGAKKIQVESKKTEAVVKSSFGGMSNSIKGFGTALTAGLSIGLLGGLVKKTLDYATSIKDVAKQVGVTTKELQEFRYAASQVGVTQDAADKGLEKLSLTMSKAAAGSKTATSALAAVGVTLKDVQTKSRTEIFGQIADQMIKQGGAAKNAAAANAIFGESAAKLNPLLDAGSKGMSELAAAANRLGVVLSDSQIQNADETAQKLDDVRRVLAAQIAGVVADNASSIVSLSQALGHLTSSIVNFLGSNPQAALAIIGALAGGRVGGLPGAAAGAIAGFKLGEGPQAAADKRNLEGNTALLRHNRDKLAADIRKKRAAGQGITQRELNRLVSLNEKVNGPAAASFGNAPLPQFLAGAGPKARKGRTPRGPRDRSDDVSFQFDQELRRAHIDVLRAQQGLAKTSDERARIALELLDADREMQQAELNDRVRRAERDFAEGKITAGTLEQVKAQAQKLKAEYDDADALQRKAIADDLAADKARDAAELSDSRKDLDIELLQLESSLAETAKEKRDVELRILQAMKDQEKARLEALAADQDAAPLARAQAQQRLNELDNIYAGRAAVVRQGTRGPMEQFGAEFGDISEELEQLKVQGIMGAADALTHLTEGWDSFRDAALSAIKQVIAELIRLQLMKLAANIIGTAAGAPGAGAVAGGNFFSNGGYVGIGTPSFASGGGFNVKGIPGVDRNTLSMNGLPIANVSYGERISVSNDNGKSAGGGMPAMHFHFGPGTSDRDARRTGMQAATAFRQEISRSARKGM